MRFFVLLAVAGCLFLAPFGAMAHSVVPEAERKAALKQLSAGAPTKTSGIAALKKLGTVKLEGEFDTVKGRVLRTREIVFSPGAVVALHEHLGRPGVAYIIEGEMTEYRVGADGRAVGQESRRDRAGRNRRRTLVEERQRQDGARPGRGYRPGEITGQAFCNILPWMKKLPDGAACSWNGRQIQLPFAYEA